MKRLVLLILGLMLQHAAMAQPPSLDRFIDAYALRHDFSGTILVQGRGQVRFMKSYGLANIPFAVENRDDTKYKIASITKVFTSALILQLQREGSLDLDGTISTYLPDYSGNGADKVRIRHLLGHTSGLPNFDQVTSLASALESGLPTYQTPYSIDQLLQRFCSGDLVRPPGTVFDYNNADYIILGKIVERLHGRPFADVLKENILAPLGMHDTGMLNHNDVIARLADTYFVRDDLGSLSNDLPVYPENWYAAGAMYSTAADLLKFSNALFAEGLLGQDALAALLTPGLDDYGLGLWVYDTTIHGRKHRIAKRPGSIMGARSQFYRDLDGDLAIIILGNTGTTDLDAFVAEIGKRSVD